LSPRVTIGESDSPRRFLTLSYMLNCSPSSKVPLLIKDHTSLLYLHAPKCGGSSVVDTFKKAGFKVTLEMRGLPPQACLYSSPQHQTCSALKKIIRLDRLSDIFVVTRNPYDRLKSEFNWHFRDTPQEDRPCYSEWVIESLESAKTDAHYMDNHFRPVIDYLDPAFPARIFRFEDKLEAIVEFFVQPIGSVQNARILHQKDSSTFMHTNADLRLNNQAKDIANQFYLYDFMAFGYPISATQDTSYYDNLNQTPNFKEKYDMRIKVDLAKKWHKETQDLLLAKLNAQCNNLSDQLDSINFSIFNTLDHRRSTSQLGASAICYVYDNILLKLSKVKTELEDVVANPADQPFAIRYSHINDLITDYRQRIATGFSADESRNT